MHFHLPWCFQRVCVGVLPLLQIRERVHELRLDKTNKVTVRPAKTQISLGIRPVWSDKVTVRPAKTQISLGIRPVWSESSLSAWWKLGWCPGWSESLLGAQSLCWFCHVAAHMKIELLWPPCLLWNRQGARNLLLTIEACIPGLHFSFTLSSVRLLVSAILSSSWIICLCLG